MIGFIKIYRKITNNFLYTSERFDKLHAWLDLLILATFCKRTVLIRGVKLSLEAGELCYSQKSLAARWGWNERTVAKFLKLLEDEQMIQCRITHVTTIITILNWDEYNGYTELNTEQGTLRVVAVDTQPVHSEVQTNKESKEDINNNNIENFENVNKAVNNSVDGSGVMMEKAVTKGGKIFGFQTSLHKGDKLEGEL